jgi:thiol-disulfide isomerase/thioredoxin
MRKLVEVSTENHYKKALLLDEYPQTFLLYTRGKNLKSTDDTDHITARDISYYDGVITKDFADTSRYFVAHFDLLSKISQDTLLHLPEIGKAGIQNYLARLRVLFGYIFDGHNLFYDMMVATAYINEIENGQFLSASSKSDIIRYFKNRHLSNYILYQNTIYSLKNNKKPSGEHFFSFPGNEDDVLNHILERYSGKIVIMDFWATWCGPCIQAFEQNKEIKNRFKDNDNVVFVYMTGESSDQSKWREYVETVGGEHFYLYDNQLATIFQRHGITSIPSYLLFDKSGTLRKKITGSLTNKEIIEWIEATLTE